MTDNEKPDLKWVILEAMGHQKVGGVYYFENGLHRVDIPDTSPDAPPDRFIRSEYYGNPAIFRITPVTEEAARLVAKSNIIPDAIPWDVRHELKQLAAPQETIEHHPDYAADPDEDDYYPEFGEGLDDDEDDH